MALLPGLIARGVRGLRAKPQQRLAQRTIGLRAAVRQRAKQIHTLTARRVLIGQGFAQRQPGADILRMRRRELPQRVDRLRQQGAIARHRQVVLRRHAGGRLVAVKGVAPRLQRRGDIAAARLLTRQRQLRLWDRLQLARVVQLAQARVLRRDAAQLLAVARRAFDVAALLRVERQQIERLRIVRFHHQHFLQRGLR